jgi:hypothetical protein
MRVLVKIESTCPISLSTVKDMEEPGEQCTVVFALIVTEPARRCVCGGGGQIISIRLCKNTTCPFTSLECSL